MQNLSQISKWGTEKNNPHSFKNSKIWGTLVHQLTGIVKSRNEQLFISVNNLQLANANSMSTPLKTFWIKNLIMVLVVPKIKLYVKRQYD